MVFMANRRKNKEKGDPKVGGHVSASTSALHILGALHLVVKSGFDHMANKPHASPADHAYNFMLDLFLNEDLSKLSETEGNTAMQGLRAFPQDGEPVFQSYHSAYDPDRHNFLPSGTVGIPAVMSGYLAHAYTFAKKHGYEVPDAHFWCVIGDSEFREGSLFEAVPEFAERQIGNLTWIIDYNRQSLDGHRITNKNIMAGTDDTRIARTMKANGWEVIEVRHGKLRKKLFSGKGGKRFQELLEEELDDYEFQVLLQLKDAKEIRRDLKKHQDLEEFLNTVSDQDLYDAIHDLGGHDFEALVEAMEQSKQTTDRPTVIIAHTIKGWGLKMAAEPGNHNSLPDADEMQSLREKQGISDEVLFARFDTKTPEGQFLKARGESLYKEILKQNEIKEKNQKYFLKQYEEFGSPEDSLNINLKMASYPHTQWMLGQLTAKLTRIANTPLDEKKLAEKQKPLSTDEKSWKMPSEMIVSMAPDVGTSTNLNPSMDGKIFGMPVVEDIEAEFGVKDTKTPDLVPGQEDNDRFLRFEIVEANTMSCMGSYGKLRDLLGIPLLPLMTVYDFFVKRALDQFFYNLYWKSSFIMVGTPAGVTLSPEGAQHGWKSDFQIPNQIVWEPFFCQELDWILCDAIKRHITNDNEGRNGVHIRGVTRGAEQKDFLRLLKTQRRFKTQLEDTQKLHPKGHALDGAIDESSVEALSEDEMMNAIKSEVLAGAYRLIDYRGYAGYEPGDNVVNIFALGSLGTEAIKASEQLLEKGIYANVFMVTSPDLLVGNLAYENGYYHLTQTLGINSDLYLLPTMNGALQPAEAATLSGRRVPIVSVADGEIGLLDNLGSIIGVKHEALGVRKHSRCGRPSDIYKYHGIDAQSVAEACGRVLAMTAVEQVKVSGQAVQTLQQQGQQPREDWQNYWPQKN
ncbi:MAG: pyruvate dehydrogenase [Bdellovibrionales bacterium]|nr:pyruvate dehydrogenase [Bdellovibrionales bacterium]